MKFDSDLLTFSDEMLLHECLAVKDSKGNCHDMVELKDKTCVMHETMMDMVEKNQSGLQMISQLTVSSQSDMAWIRRIGWAILIAAVSVIMSIWAILFPYLTGINNSLQSVTQLVTLTTHRVLLLERGVDERKVQHAENLKAIQKLEAEVHLWNRDQHKDKGKNP